jgi:1-acyl-sn-glycerol-3-phosphate acyltransferase
MLHFIIVYIWSWMILPGLFLILRPFVRLDSLTNCCHFVCTVLGVKHTITGEKLLDTGFILANHRCHMDAMYDVYVSQSVIVGRRLVVVASPFVSLLAYIDNRLILINRGKDTRHDIFKRCVSHINRYQNKRILFYPEGTRNTYATLRSHEELKSYIRFGQLKSIYEDCRFPVQLLISSNKEHAYNEKKLHVKYGAKINTKISKVIYALQTKILDRRKICG